MSAKKKTKLQLMRTNDLVVTGCRLAGKMVIAGEQLHCTYVMRCFCRCFDGGRVHGTNPLFPLCPVSKGTVLWIPTLGLPLLLESKVEVHSVNRCFTSTLKYLLALQAI